MEERDLGRCTCGIQIELINNFGARCKSYEAAAVNVAILQLLILTTVSTILRTSRKKSWRIFLSHATSLQHASTNKCRLHHKCLSKNFKEFTTRMTVLRDSPGLVVFDLL